jgi:hypothetical protein
VWAGQYRARGLRRLMNDDTRDSDMARRLARAEAAVADLAKSYVSWASADVQKCAEFLAAARASQATGDMPAGAVDDRMIATQALYAVAHNIKGQGSSFGFQLMTRLGDSLCLLTRGKRPFSDADLNVVQAHLDAMRLVLSQEIRGDGGALGDKLAQKLEAMVRDVIGAEAQKAQAGLIR